MTPTLQRVAMSPLVGLKSTFFREYPEPVLLVPLPAATDEAFDGAATKPIPMIAKAGNELVPRSRLAQTFREATIVPVRKSPRNELPHVTLGRSPFNDITIPTSTLSKMHCYFTYCPGGSFTISDAGSTNGTWVDGNRLSAHTPLLLQESATILLGRELSCLFASPGEFLELATILRGGMPGS